MFLIESRFDDLLNSRPMSEHASWIDSHSHLADSRWTQEELAVAMALAKEQGLSFFMQGGVSPEDWERQQILAQNYPGRIGLCFGLHPYFVAANEEEVCEQALDQLARALPKAMALGETGLDFRPYIMKDSRERQLDVFEAQLALAAVAAKPVVLHLVQAHKEALAMFDTYGLPKQGGMVHSFNGSASQAQDFLRRGLYLSVGGPACRPDNIKLHQALREIPLEKLLIESDSPDQPPPEYKDQKNPPHSILRVAEFIGRIRGLSGSEILDISASNFRRLFPKLM